MGCFVPYKLLDVLSLMDEGLTDAKPEQTILFELIKYDNMQKSGEALWTSSVCTYLWYDIGSVYQHKS